MKSGRSGHQPNVYSLIPCTTLIKGPPWVPERYIPILYIIMKMNTLLSHRPARPAHLPSFASTHTPLLALSFGLMEYAGCSPRRVFNYSTRSGGLAFLLKHLVLKYGGTRSECRPIARYFNAKAACSFNEAQFDDRVLQCSYRHLLGTKPNL